MGTDGAVFTVSVKWRQQTFPSLQIDTSEPPELFKSQLWTLTGVPPPRQTILGLKGGRLRDDADWGSSGLREGMTLKLIGTPDASLPPPPAAADLPPVRDDLDAEYVPAEPANPAAPPGLANLGNTCYLNASVQCLTAVAPLMAALRRYPGRSAASDPSERLSASLRDVVARLRVKATVSVNPFAFLTALRQVNPQFAERDRSGSGMFMQQDAEECWGEILTRLASALLVDPADATRGNWVDRLFAIHTKSEDRCGEGDAEEVVRREENVRALKCHISHTVNHLAQGVREGLEETIEKHSDALGRSAEWKRTSRLDQLPPFLIVQFVRFFWKPAEQVKAKILRNVSFPVQLDVYDFCTDELKEKLDVKRDEARAKADAAIAGKGEAEGGGEGEGSGSGAGAASGGVGRGEGEEEIAAETGNYELCAVLTHQGRAADAGHYVAWVKDEGTRWFKFDDDKVSVHTEEEVKKLSGGGDWHMAYMCLYRAKNVF